LKPPSHSSETDVAVIGGGPAGAAAARALALAGRRVVVVERERFPRFHVGESLLSTSVDSLEALGLRDRVEAAGFAPKLGADLYSADGAVGRRVEFASSSEIRTPRTYQVDRAAFDRLLLDAARDAGAEVREGERVTGCAIHGDGVRIDLAAGEAISARAVIDASGRAGVVARARGLRRDEPQLANVAIYGHYEGVRAPDDRETTDLRLVSGEDARWLWVIPLDERRTSVGVVLPMALYRSLERGSPQAMLEREIAGTPLLAAWCAEARPALEARVEKDFSYEATAYAGDRFLLVGDAGSFLDPVFSTGVAIALESGLEAARDLDRALAAGDLSRRRFRSFERTQRRRFARYRRMVLAFYTPWFRDLFFQPQAPQAMFRAVVTLLAGNWRPRWTTRLLLESFYLTVAVQRRLAVVPRVFRRDGGSGFLGASGSST